MRRTAKNDLEFDMSVTAHNGQGTCGACILGKHAYTKDIDRELVLQASWCGKIPAHFSLLEAIAR